MKDDSNFIIGYERGIHAHLQRLPNITYKGFLTKNFRQYPIYTQMNYPFAIDGLVASAQGLVGPVYSKHFKVPEMELDITFKGMTRGGCLVLIPEEVLKEVNTDQK